MDVPNRPMSLRSRSCKCWRRQEFRLSNRYEGVVSRTSLIPRGVFDPRYGRGTNPAEGKIDKEYPASSCMFDEETADYGQSESTKIPGYLKGFDEVGRCRSDFPVPMREFLLRQLLESRDQLRAD